MREEGPSYPAGLSSTIILPSFGSEPSADQRHLAAQPGQRLKRRRDRLAQRFARACRLGVKRHRVLFAFAAHDEAQRAEFGVALADLDDLGGMDEQAPDLGRLIRAPHPAFEAAGRGPGREVAGGEAQQRIVALKARHHDLADLARGGGFVGSRGHDLDDEFIVDKHAGQKRAVGAIGLVGDDSEIRGGVGLARLDAVALELGAQGGRQRGAGHQRLVQGRDVDAGRARLVENDLEKVGRAAIDAGPEMRDRGDQQFGIAGTGGDDRAAKRQRAAFEDPSAGGEVIGKAVDDDLRPRRRRPRQGPWPRPRDRDRRTQARKFPRAKRTDAGTRSSARQRDRQAAAQRPASPQSQTCA